MGAVAENLVELVKDALEHLYDPAHLRDHPLTRHLLADHLPPGIGPAHAVRQALLDGIEHLNYSASLPAGARQNRAHQILILRYVEALPFREVMTELSLSQPQFHREQRHALELLTALLTDVADASRAKTDPLATGGIDARRYAEFDAAIHRNEGPIEIDEVIRGVAPMLVDVAAQVNVILRVEMNSSPTFTRANRTALRQLVIGLVGYVLCAARAGEVVLRTRADAGPVLRADFRGVLDRLTLDQPEARDRLAVVSRLASAMNSTLSINVRNDGTSVAVQFPASQRTLLVIDDNADAVQLVARLLADQHFTVLSAQNVRDGLDVAQSARPDAILLDIMMPDQDGWEALQSLKNNPVTEDVPVLVCTVLAEARLAMALGAAEFIRKPLTRPRLLEALERWTAAPRSTEERSRRSGAAGSAGDRSESSDG